MNNVPVQAFFTGKNQLIWKFANQKVNVFGPAHIEKLHFKGVFGCIFSQCFMKFQSFR
jgi:hypothetical protein